MNMTEENWVEMDKRLSDIEANILSCNENVRAVANAVGRIENILKEAAEAGELSVTIYQEFKGSADELYDAAEELVVKAGRASTSFLQRRLGIGYSRAAHLLDKLEEEGVIGFGKGSKPREVLK